MPPAFAIESLTAESAPYPMRSPFTSAKRRSAVAENVRVTCALGDGTRGYGEGSPAAYVTGETAQSVLLDCQLAAPGLLGLDVRRQRICCELLAGTLPNSPTGRAAVEMALLDSLTRALGIGLWHWFGGATDEIRTDLTIPIADSPAAAAIARAAAENGYRSLKIKVGGPDPESDRVRVLAVAAAAPGCGLRLDANQAFTPAAALAFVRDLLEHDVAVELLEQPVPNDDLDGLAAVTRESPVPVIADEAVLSAADALRIARRGAAHGINIKLAKLGFSGALEAIAVARAAGLKLMLGCMLESLLGSGAAVHLACGTGAFDYLDLDSHTLIGLEPEGTPFAQEGERIRVAAECVGIGWQPTSRPT